MIMLGAIILILLIKPDEIKSQKYIFSDRSKKDTSSNSKDYGIKMGAKLSDEELHHAIKSLEPHACRVKDPSKYCSSFRTCYECVNSMKYSCNWCHNFGCSYKEDKLCTVFTMDTFDAKNLSCPFIYSKTPILIPSGIGNSVAVKINIPDPALIERDLVCQINVNSHMVHAKGIPAKNVVYCFPPRLVIDNERVVGTLKLLWDGVEPYSNEVPVYVYRCEKMAKNCLDCRQLPLKYGCGWCQNMGICATSEKCKDPVGWSYNKDCQTSM